MDTPELRGAERPRGLAARDALRGVILGKAVTLCTMRDRRGKYGRPLVRIFLDEGGVRNVNAWLILAGLGEPHGP